MFGSQLKRGGYMQGIQRAGSKLGGMSPRKVNRNSKRRFRLANLMPQSSAAVPFKFKIYPRSFSCGNPATKDVLLNRVSEFRQMQRRAKESEARLKKPIRLTRMSIRQID
ncbi:MAG: hypothetical protein WBD10_12955 [Acidobacteriaceae bacterium]